MMPIYDWDGHAWVPRGRLQIRRQRTLDRIRLTAIVALAASAVSLASSTLYVISTWAPA